MGPQLEWQQPSNLLPADERPTSSSSCATTTEQVERKPKRKKRNRRRHRAPYPRTQFLDMPKLTPVESKEQAASSRTESATSHSRLADKFATIFESVLSSSRNDASTSKTWENTRSTDDESTRAASRTSITELAEKLIVEKDPASLASSLMQNLDEKQLKQLARILGGKLFGELKPTAADVCEVNDSALQNSDSSSPTSTTTGTVTTNTTNGNCGALCSPAPTQSPQTSVPEMSVERCPVDNEVSEDGDIHHTIEEFESPQKLTLEQRRMLARLHRYRLNASASLSQTVKTDIMRLTMRFTKVHLSQTCGDIEESNTARKTARCFKKYSDMLEEQTDAAPTLSRCDKLDSSCGLEAEEDQHSELDMMPHVIGENDQQETSPLATSTPLQSPVPSPSSEKQPIKLNLGELKRRSSKTVFDNRLSCSVTDDHKLPPKKRRKTTKPIDEAESPAKPLETPQLDTSYDSNIR